MKFGIDVNIEKLCNIVIEKIKGNGYIAVDLTWEKWLNKGQEVFKKVLLANITNIDFFIGIEFIKNYNECRIFYSNNELSKACSIKIKKILSEDIDNIICEDGNCLYLIKNIDSPGIYIRIPEGRNDYNIKIIEKIIDQLINK